MCLTRPSVVRVGTVGQLGRLALKPQRWTRDVSSAQLLLASSSAGPPELAVAAAAAVLLAGEIQPRLVLLEGDERRRENLEAPQWHHSLLCPLLCSLFLGHQFDRQCRSPSPSCVLIEVLLRPAGGDPCFCWRSGHRHHRWWWIGWRNLLLRRWLRQQGLFPTIIFRCFYLWGVASRAGLGQGLQG